LYVKEKTKKVRKFFLVLGVVAGAEFIRLHGQLSEGGIPPGLLMKFKNLAEEEQIIELPSVDTAALLAEEEKDGQLRPFRVAYNHQVNLSVYNSGRWITMADGSRFWRIHIRSRHAYSLMVCFSAFDIPEGARVFMYDQFGRYIFGAYTSVNNNPSGWLTTTPVPGDMATVEYQVPAGVSPGQLTIGMVAHDYKNAGVLKDGYFGRSANCEVDINCDSGKNWQLEKRAVCRLFIPKQDGYTYLCTGTLINNTAQDGTPYVLSANHCISDDYAANRTLFIFNYESPY